MPTQKQIADHLDLSQPAVVELMEKLQISWKTTPLDQIRVAYLRHLRGVAAGHKTSDGTDLTHERVLTERVDRELKMLTVAEKRGLLVNVTQLEQELAMMVGAFRSELLSRDDKLKSELDALYGIEVDLTLLNEHTFAALAQLARYDAGEQGAGAPPGVSAGAAGAPGHDSVGAQLPGHVGQGIGTAGPV